jgi:hypothetical protein
MTDLMEMKLLTVEDVGAGRQRILLTKPDLLFNFVEWYNEWLFKKEADRVAIREEELKVLAGVVHFAKKSAKNEKGLTKLNLTEMQNDSMKEMGYLIKMDDVNSLVEKKILLDKMMETNGLFTQLQVEEVEKMALYWGIIYGLKRITR